MGELIRVIGMIKEDFELPGSLITEIFNLLLTKLSHRWHIKLRQAHGHQSWTWCKRQTIKKLANYSCSFIFETALESDKYDSDREGALPWFFKQKERPAELYIEMSEFMINRNILRECGGDLEDYVKRRNAEQSQAEEIIHVL
ncbi:hypothetical protein O181_008968 [Austropuccinia psidii MF-1]|uniref:Uncharacterized protein n=1 Tax=Austropuccinia psidii MF-1 TaxID=1389203 RepID=A0A9Q3GJ04_9BASI|nr:hypothetical protein [Austropuccinia psidii MF-1]